MCCEFIELSLEIVARLRARFDRGKSSCAPQCLNLKGFAGTLNPTFGAPGRGASELSFRRLARRRSASPMSGDPMTSADHWVAWPARATPPAQEDLNPTPQVARAPQNTAGHGRRGRPDARCRLDVHLPWVRWSSGAWIDERKASAHPYLVRQMSDFGFRQNPQGSNTGVHIKISPFPAGG